MKFLIIFIAFLCSYIKIGTTDDKNGVKIEIYCQGSPSPTDEGIVPEDHVMVAIHGTVYHYGSEGLATMAQKTNSYKDKQIPVENWHQTKMMATHGPDEVAKMYNEQYLDTDQWKAEKFDPADHTSMDFAWSFVNTIAGRMVYLDEFPECFKNIEYRISKLYNDDL